MKFFGRKEKPEKTAQSQPADTVSTAPAELPMADEQGMFLRFRRGLSRTGGQFSNGIGALFLGRKVIDEDVLEALEDQLLTADVGI